MAKKKTGKTKAAKKQASKKKVAKKAPARSGGAKKSAKKKAAKKAAPKKKPAAKKQVRRLFPNPPIMLNTAETLILFDFIREIINDQPNKPGLDAFLNHILSVQRNQAKQINTSTITIDIDHTGGLTVADVEVQVTRIEPK